MACSKVAPCETDNPLVKDEAGGYYATTMSAGFCSQSIFVFSIAHVQKLPRLGGFLLLTKVSKEGMECETPMPCVWWLC
jgi:hypothetical protein